MSGAGNSLASVGGFCAGDREIVDHQRLSGTEPSLERLLIHANKCSGPGASQLSQLVSANLPFVAGDLIQNATHARLHYCQMLSTLCSLRSISTCEFDPTLVLILHPHTFLNPDGSPNTTCPRAGLGYCFSASLPPYLATAAVGALDVLEDGRDSLLPAVTGNARLLRSLLSEVPGDRVCSRDDGLHLPQIAAEKGRHLQYVRTDEEHCWSRLQA